MNMKIKSINPKDGIQAAKHRKENHFIESFILLAVYKGNLKEVAEMRIYGTNAMNYACFWLHSYRNETTVYANGSGSAGGYGYHRPSAAADTAFRTAGIEIEDISGRGDSAITHTLESLGKRLGYRKVYVIKAHG